MHRGVLSAPNKGGARGVRHLALLQGRDGGPVQSRRRGAHPGGKLPSGQQYHAAGPSEGGWLVVAVWNSKSDYDTFMTGTLIPALGATPGAFTSPPEERSAEVTNLVTG